jgi:hypothetical protein
MDILVLFRDFVFDLIYNFPPGLTSYILRVGVLLILSSAVLGFAWMYLPWRTVFSQACVALIAIVIALYFPVDRFREGGEEFLTFTVLVACGAMIFLPRKLPFWLTPRMGNQLRLKRIIICMVWAGLAVQILTGR